MKIQANTVIIGKTRLETSFMKSVIRGKRLTVKDSVNNQGKNSSKYSDILRSLLLRYGLPVWRQIFAIVVLTVISNLIASTQPLFVSAILDSVLGADSTQASTPSVGLSQ